MRTNNHSQSALQAVTKEAKHALRPLIGFSAGINILEATISGYISATDADKGDTLTYVLKGAVPAGFTFVQDGKILLRRQPRELSAPRGG